MSSNYVLIISDKADTHADLVEKKLKEKNVDSLRLNTEEYSSENQISFSFGNELNSSLSFIIKNKKYNLSEIGAIWYRKPFSFWPIKRHTFKSKIAESMTRSETDQVIQASLIFANQNTNIFILNERQTNLVAGYKPLQLAYAKEIGFSIPRSLISSSSKNIKELINNCNNSSVLKLMGHQMFQFGNKRQCFDTNELTLEHYNKISKKTNHNYPIFIQEKIKKISELRITVVGKKIFACEIDVRSIDKKTIDIRATKMNLLPHKPLKLTKSIEKKCFLLLKKFNLQYAAIDMAVDTDGNYIFFEINPNGQYLWIENLTGMPISQAIADLLANPEENKL